MKVVAYTDDNAFDALQGEWNDLVQRSIANSIFSTLEWQQNWWHAYHPGQLWVLALRTDDDQLVGIGSFFISEGSPTSETDAGSATGKILHLVGCEDVTDYLDLIIDRDYLDAGYRALVSYMYNHQDAFERMVLCNIPQHSPTREQFVHVLQDCRFEVEVQQRDVCPVITLGNSFDDYLESLDKKQRHELRRKLRRADGAQDMGVLKWYVVDAEQDLDAHIEQFFDLMRTSQHDKAQFLQNPQHVAFFKAMVPTMQRAGWLRMAFLSMNEEPIAAYLNFDYDNRVFVYNSGLNPNKHGNISPGIVLICYLIQQAIADGRTAFDFLRGDEEYKYRLGGQDTAVYNLTATRIA